MFKTVFVFALVGSASASLLLKGKPSAKGPKGKGGKGASTSNSTFGESVSTGSLCTLDTLGSPCGNPYWEYGLDNGYGAWCTINTESEPVCIASGGCITYECDSSSQCPKGWHCFDNGGWGNECGEACKGDDCYEAMPLNNLLESGYFEEWEYSGDAERSFGQSSTASNGSMLFGAMFALAGASLAGFFTYSVMHMQNKKHAHTELAQDSVNSISSRL